MSRARTSCPWGWWSRWSSPPPAAAETRPPRRHPAARDAAGAAQAAEALAGARGPVDRLQDRDPAWLAGEPEPDGRRQGRPDPLARPLGRRHPGGRSRPRCAGGAAGRVRDQRAGGPAGFQTQLEPSTPRPFPGTPFAAVQTAATGTTKARGIKERTTLLVLRREGIVNYTVAIVENARRGQLGEGPRGGVEDDAHAPRPARRSARCRPNQRPPAAGHGRYRSRSGRSG